MIEPYDTWEHPNGGKIEWFEVAGRHFSLLDNDYEFAEDYELHEWPKSRESFNEPLNPIPGSELRFVDRESALTFLDLLVVN